MFYILFWNFTNAKRTKTVYLFLPKFIDNVEIWEIDFFLDKRKKINRKTILDTINKLPI